MKLEFTHWIAHLQPLIQFRRILNVPIVYEFQQKSIIQTASLIQDKPALRDEGDKAIINLIDLTFLSRGRDILQASRLFIMMKGFLGNMSFSKKVSQPSRYIIQVKGHLDCHWEQWFEGMKITPADKETTILSGDVIDQSALHGLLETIHSLNLILVSVQRIDNEDASK